MEAKRILLKGRIVNPEGVSDGMGIVEVTGHSITYSGDDGTFCGGMGHQVYSFGPGYICPGFIDMHVHGSGGADTMDGTYEALNLMSQALARGGTTSFAAATMSAPRPRLASVVENAASVVRRGTEGAQLLGVHLEGPFLNPAKKGAQREEDLRLPDLDELKGYLDSGVIRMLTVAPELEGALELIAYAKAKGVVVSMGHTAASITQVQQACAAGLSHVTHAFNSMAGLHHRDLGTMGAIMSMRELTADIIPDGIHVHPSVVKILTLSKGIENVCAITDCIRAGQMGDGVFELGGQEVEVKNGAAHLRDGTIAGSTISMAQAVETIAGVVGLTMSDAVRMASTNPARILGLDSKGVLKQGKDADIVVLDHSFRVLLTIVAGRVVYSSV